MNTLLRILNTLLLAGILTVLILIFRHIPQVPREPVEVTVSSGYKPIEAR